MAVEAMAQSSISVHWTTKACISWCFTTAINMFTLLATLQLPHFRNIRQQICRSRFVLVRNPRRVILDNINVYWLKCGGWQSLLKPNQLLTLDASPPSLPLFRHQGVSRPQITRWSDWIPSLVGSKGIQRDEHRGGSINGGTPKWMVDKGKYHENDRTWMKTGGTPVSGNLHIMEFNGT